MHSFFIYVITLSQTYQKNELDRIGWVNAPQDRDQPGGELAMYELFMENWETRLSSVRKSLVSPPFVVTNWSLLELKASMLLSGYSPLSPTTKILKPACLYL